MSDRLQAARDRVMQALWRAERSIGSAGLTATELAAATGYSETTVNKAIRELTSEAPPLLIEGHKRHSEIPGKGKGRRAPRQIHPGKLANCYRIDQDVVITWRCTATLVLKVLESPWSKVPRDELVKSISDMNLVHPYTRTKYTRDQIEERINLALRLGRYLQLDADDQSLLTTTARAPVEKGYLRFLETEGDLEPLI
jgi:hypothetical protein